VAHVFARLTPADDFKGKFLGNHNPSTIVKASRGIGCASNFLKWGTKIMRYTLLVAALAASVATPALAQSVVATVNDATAKGVVLLPLTLSETKQLDFGTVIADPSNPGNVVIDADSGARSVGGAVLAVPSYPGGRGLFQGAGTAGNDVVLTLVPPAVLRAAPTP